MLADNFGISVSEETKIKGQIVCARGENYFVECDGKQFDITARGRIKYDKGEILTGDFVEVENGAITKVYPRFSRFLRPNVANVECLVIVICDKPQPDFMIVDKLLLSANYANIEYAVVINKIDIGNDCFSYITNEYPFLKNVFCVSADRGEGILQLREFLQGKSVAFAGQSAVGKTSLINKLTGTDFVTGRLSHKSGRGRHTTTYSRILRADGFSVFDTPGFSELYADVHPSDVAANFQPYEDYLCKCKFCDCTHTDEPDCAVKTAVSNGLLSLDRYERYKIIYKEILAEYKKRYG